MLALADVLGGAAVMAVLVALFDHAEFNPAMLIAMPLIVAVNKLARLYDRDDLVLRKSTLDEAPVLLQLAGLYALLVWLVHDALASVELGPRRAPVGRASGARPRARGRAARGAHGRRDERCLVLGDPSAAALLERKLSEGRARVEVVAPCRSPARQRRRRRG